MTWKTAMGLSVVVCVGAGCVAPQTNTRAERTYDDEYVRIGRMEGYVDESGLHFRIDPSEAFIELADERGVSTEELTQLTFGTGGGRGVNPGGTYELVTCRSGTSPACSVQYGPTIEPTTYPITDPKHTSACGAIPGVSSSTCYAADVELREHLGVELANVYIAFTGTTSAAGPNVVIPYGGAVGAMGLNGSLNDNTYRYGSLEPGPLLEDGANFNAPFHQASLRRWRFAYPVGTTDFNFSFQGNVYATIATGRAPHQASVTERGDATATAFHMGCVSDNGDVHVGVAIEPTTSRPQVYWHRRRTGEFRWVSRTPVGTLGSGSSAPDAVGNACVSADGSLVVFDSRYPLTITDTDPATFDVYAVTVATGGVEHISHFGANSATLCGGVDDKGSRRPAVSANGAFIAFESTCSEFCSGKVGCAAGVSQVYRYQRGTATLIGISQTDGSSTNFGTAHSTFASISGDGSRVSFQSLSTDLIAPSETGSTIDIFVRNVGSESTTRITDNAGSGYSAPQLSRNGEFVIFVSKSAEFVAGVTDGNDLDVFRCTTAGTGCVYVSLENGSSTVSPDSDSGSTTVIGASISADGNIIAFESVSTGLVAGDTNAFQDIFVRNMTTNATVRLSVDAFGSQGDAHSMSPRVSANTTGDVYVGFESAATNIMFDSLGAGAFDSADNSSDVFSVRL